MKHRDITSPDLLYILKNGFVYEDAEVSTQKGRYKYKIQSRTPNSSRTIRLIVIPDEVGKEIKLVTVMWVDGE